MSKVLVAGVDTVVGGNLAVCLAKTHVVTGLSLSGDISSGGCDMESLSGCTVDEILQLIQRVKPQQVVYCGVGSRTGWEGSSEPTDSDVNHALNWIQAAFLAQTHLTLVSSGAIFTGPWMFHSENSQSFCPSPAAQKLHAIETHAAQTCPDSLIVRTHGFGWTPGGQQGWLETLLSQMERGLEPGLDLFRHGSPILATDLAEIVSKAWAAGLSGTYHIAGAERANPYQFARRIAHHFQLPVPAAPVGEFLVDRPTGFGCGETSLQTRKIRRALHVSLPMLEDGVLKLFQQHHDGYRSRLSGHSVLPNSRVA